MFSLLKDYMDLGGDFFDVVFFCNMGYRRGKAIMFASSPMAKPVRGRHIP